MKKIVHPDYIYLQPKLDSLLENFKNSGELIGSEKRNIIKIFEIEGLNINIKSFKKPNFLNSIIYGYIRKSKAQRSFEYANILLENRIGTPQPIAYFENHNLMGLKNSYYISKQLECDLTFRELVENPNYPNHSTILRQFTEFSFSLHEKGIEFLDHSPGNTLIKNNSSEEFNFFLVDLNRMNFHINSMDFISRMKNLSRLTHKKEMVELMSNEYSKLYSKETEQSIFEKMWLYTSNFQERFARKRLIKKKIKFWKI